MTRFRAILVVVLGVLVAGGAAALLVRRSDPAVDIAAAFTRYQSALAAGDAGGVLAVTNSGSVFYFGDYLRDHALRRTREEMEPRSIWEQYCILVYRDVLGGEFLRTSSPVAVYTELVRQHLLLFEVKGLSLGPVTVTKDSAEGPLLRDGRPTGTSILFEREGGRWTVVTHSDVRYAIYGLHDAQAQGRASKAEFIGAMFQRLRGKPLQDSLWDPPKP